MHEEYSEKCISVKVRKGIQNDPLLSAQDGSPDIQLPKDLQSPSPDLQSPLPRLPSPAPRTPQQARGKRQGSKIPRPTPTRQAVVPKHVKNKGLSPIPGHVVSQTEVAPESKVKIFQEKLPNYNNAIGSTEFGKNTRRIPMHVSKTPPIPPTQYLPRKTSYLTSHHRFIQSEESLAVKRTNIKGIVKPNLIRKDLMKLRDPSARPRGSPKQAVLDITKEAFSRGLEIRQRQGQESIQNSTPPRIEHPKTTRPSSATTNARARAGAPHRRHVARETKLPSPRQ